MPQSSVIGDTIPIDEMRREQEPRALMLRVSAGFADSTAYAIRVQGLRNMAGLQTPPDAPYLLFRTRAVPDSALGAPPAPGAAPPPGAPGAVPPGAVEPGERAPGEELEPAPGEEDILEEDEIFDDGGDAPDASGDDVDAIEEEEPDGGEFQSRYESRVFR